MIAKKALEKSMAALDESTRSLTEQTERLRLVCAALDEDPEAVERACEPTGVHTLPVPRGERHRPNE